jgi:ubiquinone biosynthesis monooxygenase Coq7
MTNSASHSTVARSVRRLSRLDQLIGETETVLRTLSGNAYRASRPNPADAEPQPPLDAAQRQQAARLMRVNHTGEVCAQALYQGQALTAKLPTVREEMAQSAREEIDHLVWCEQRLKELDSRTSLLNPVWYGLSFAIGATAGVIGDRLSLGFVAATEERVCEHLREHLDALPSEDRRSRRIVEQMLVDEAEHGKKALDAGGWDFPRPLKRAMTRAASLMTRSSYWI